MLDSRQKTTPAKLYRFRISISIGRGNCVHLVFSPDVVVCCVQFEVHQVKINIFSIDFEKMGKRTKLPKAILLIQMDGAGIADAHLKI